MNAKTNQPDWGRIAEKFDVWLPQIAPVGEALLDALAPSPGDKVLDMASGTGEPALSLARRMAGTLDITGTDAADGMVQVALAKVRDEGLEGIRFETMPAENLTFHDNCFDKALCRFGVMLFQDPLQGVKEMYRVLKPGGRFAIAVWGEPETMPTMYWSYLVLKDRLPEDLHPPVAKVTSLGASGVLGNMLNEAGFHDVQVQERSFNYEFSSFENYWDTMEASDVLKQQYDALPVDEHARIRDEVAVFARDFVKDGRFVVPHKYWLATGVKPHNR